MNLNILTSFLINDPLPGQFKWQHIISAYSHYSVPLDYYKCFLHYVPATLEKNYTCRVVVHVWYGINIICIRHFTPPVDLSDRPFKTERDWLSCSARQQRRDHIINLSQKHRSIWEAYCLHVSFLLAVFVSYIVALNIWSLYVIWSLNWRCQTE